MCSFAFRITDEVNDASIVWVPKTFTLDNFKMAIEALDYFKKFFNTSGLQYKALGLKDKLPTMSEDEQLALLATDGLLVKRPILVGDDFVLTGFRQQEWDEKLK